MKVHEKALKKQFYFLLFSLLLYYVYDLWSAFTEYTSAIFISLGCVLCLQIFFRLPVYQSHTFLSKCVAFHFSKKSHSKLLCKGVIFSSIWYISIYFAYGWISCEVRCYITTYASVIVSFRSDCIGLRLSKPMCVSLFAEYHCKYVCQIINLCSTLNSHSHGARVIVSMGAAGCCGLNELGSPDMVTVFILLSNS